MASAPHELRIHPRQLQNYPRPTPFALALGEHPATVFPGDGAHDEQTEASSLHVAQRAIGDAIKAFEDALQLSRRNAYTLIADTQRTTCSRPEFRRARKSPPGRRST